MPKGVPTQRPLTIPFFSTGFFTYRSQLFSPFRSLGVNIVSYHDPVLDGHNMELTDLMEWQQRPAFTKFCSVPLQPGEIIHAFYSARALNGVLLPLFDSNQRLATFTATSINTIYDKDVPSQGYIAQVGDATYFCDGYAATRWDQTYNGTPFAPYGSFATPNGIAAPTSSMTVEAVGCWLPNTKYSTTAYPGATPNTNGYAVSWLNGAEAIFWPQVFDNGVFEYTWPLDGYNLPLGSGGASINTYVYQPNESIQYNTYPASFLPGLTIPDANLTKPTVVFGVTDTGTWDNTSITMWPNQPTHGRGDFCIITTGQLYIATAGTYKFHISHDNGTVVAIGGGAIPVSASVNVNPTGMTVGAQGIGGKKLPIVYCNNQQYSATGGTQQTFTVTFPTVGAYPIELDYKEWPNFTPIQDAQLALDWENPNNGNAVTPLVPMAVLNSTQSGIIGAVLLDYNGNIEYSASTSGTSGTEIPTWAALPGGFTNDGTTLTWSNLGPVGSWIANTPYTQPSVILDSNGNLQQLYTLNAPPVWNSALTFTVGESCLFGGLYYTNVKAGANVAPGTNVTNPSWILGANPAVSASTAPEWNTNVGGFTQDNFNSAQQEYWLVWQNLGPGTSTIQSGYSWGQATRTLDGHLSTMSTPTITIGPQLQGSAITSNQVSSFRITNNVATFIMQNSYHPGENVYIQGMQTGTYFNDLVWTVVSAIPPSVFNITGVEVSGSNVVTIQAANSLLPGQKPALAGLTTATFLNGVTLTVLSTGLSQTQFEANFTHAAYPFAADTGTATLTSQFTVAVNEPNVASTPDVGTVTPVIAQISGTGTLDPRCNATAFITQVELVGNVVTLTMQNNFFPGSTIFVDGLTVADWLNGYTLLLDTATPLQVTAYFVHNDFPLTADDGTAEFCAIEIYRTADGGGIWYLAGALVNPLIEESSVVTSVGTWNFVDIYTDLELQQQIVAPIAHLNDPPPGQPGSFATPFAGGTLMAYWQGRLWIAQGQYLYFDAGPDCLNGDPHQSWPPGNRFEWAGDIVAIKALSSGLVVYLSDRVGVVLGGPQTYSFYPLTIMYNFGASSPNCVWQDGQTIYLLSTQGQLWEMTLRQKTEEGHYVADYIQTTFNPGTSYLTLHRNGLDAGLFLADGSSIVLRDGINVGAWSVPATVTGGIGAIASVETSVGTFSLCAAPTEAAGYIMARDLTQWEDMGGPYNAVDVTIGSITLSQLGEALVPVEHIVGYFDAVGVNGGIDVPSCAVLPNEIKPTNAQNFIPIPQDQIIPEPPEGAAPTTSLQQLRFPIKMWNSQSSQYMHHLQIKFGFAPSNAPHTIRAVAIKQDQES